MSAENSGYKRRNSSEKLFQNEQDDTRIDTDFKQEESNNMKAYPIKPSEPSEPSARIESTTTVSVERFFHDFADLPYQPLPEHSLEQSPFTLSLARTRSSISANYPQKSKMLI